MQKCPDRSGVFVQASPYASGRRRFIGMENREREPEAARVTDFRHIETLVFPSRSYCMRSTRGMRVRHVSARVVHACGPNFKTVSSEAPNWPCRNILGATKQTKTKENARDDGYLHVGVLWILNSNFLNARIRRWQT